MNIDDKLKEAKDAAWDAARNAAGDASAYVTWDDARVATLYAAAYAARYAARNAVGNAANAAWGALRSVGEANKQKEIAAQIELILEQLD